MTRRLAVLLVILAAVVGLAGVAWRNTGVWDAGKACAAIQTDAATYGQWAEEVRRADNHGIQAAHDRSRWRPLSDAIGELHIALVAGRETNGPELAALRECARAGF